MSVRISQLSFEHHRTAIGIGQARPRISWRFEGVSKDWIQKSCEISIRRGDLPEELFTIRSAESVLVPWPSHALESGKTAIVRVRAFGGKDAEATEWSASEIVEAGLLNQTDWKCELIESTAKVDHDQPKTPILFRRRFTTTRNITNARLYSTAHGVYEVELNGRRVGEHVLAPGWTNYEHRLPYQTFDVTPLLVVGENVIAAEVGEGWYAGRLGFLGGKRNIYGSVLGFICQLAITYDDGSIDIIGTDKQWKASTGAIVTSEIYDGEVCDARLFQTGWSSPMFDEGSWVNVKTSPLATIVSKLVAPEAPPVRCIEKLPALEVIKSPSGKVIIDFGQNLVGWVRVQVQGPSGHKITFTHTEVLEHGECATRPLREAAAKDTLILSGTQITWEPKFTFHGFRYVDVENWPTADEVPNLKDINAMVIFTDMERTGWFECSEPLLEKLHENIVWGMKGNFISIPTDCPQRDERLGWTGDIQVFGPTATFLFDCYGMLHDWCEILAIEQLEDGGSVPPLVSPNILTNTGKTPNAVWGDCVVSIPWDLYRASGDTEILKDQYESMRKWLDSGIVRDHRGLWDAEKGFQLGDWLDPAAPPSDPGNGRTDNFLVANAYLIGMTDLLATISGQLGFQSDSQRYQQSASSLRHEFAAEYITTNGRVLSDSQTSLALAIHFSLFATPEQERVAAKRLAFIIRSKAKFRIATGFAGTAILGHALTKVGMAQLFYRMLLHRKNPSWLYPVTMGATTMWERWDSMLPDGSINPGEMTSFNHYALGSVGSWMHQVMGGLSALEPGWRKILIRPLPGGGITRTKVAHLSPYGLVSVEWRIEKETFHLRVVVPPNTTAEVHVPGKEAVVTGSGEHSFEAVYEAPVWPPLPIYSPFEPHDDDEP